MKHILVTGAEGQLGNSLKEKARLYDHFAYIFVDIKDLDLTNKSLVQNYFTRHTIDYIINCAAFTAVDEAEKNPEQAFAVNEGIPSLLGSLCLQHPIHLIHLSTDYVYQGESYMPHVEEENPVAASVYAKSKLSGEMSLWNNPNALIIRTSWLYSEFGNNFLKTILRLSHERSELRIVFDQVGSPTYAGDLAQKILDIILFSEENAFMPGIYNYSNEGVCSWYDIAVEILCLTESSCSVKPIRTSEYPLPAKRPAYSVMDKSKIKTTFGLHIPHWKQGLITAVNNLKYQKQI